MSSMMSNLVTFGVFALILFVALLMLARRRQRRLRDLDSVPRRAGNAPPDAPPFEPRF
jgi:hypothetical protein